MRGQERRERPQSRHETRTLRGAAGHTWRYPQQRDRQGQQHQSHQPKRGEGHQRRSRCHRDAKPHPAADSP